MTVVVALGDIRWCVAARPLLTSVWWSSCRCCGCPADSIQPAQLYLQQMFPGGLQHSSCSTCGAKLPSTSQHWNTQRTSRLDHMVHCMWEKPGYTVWHRSVLDLLCWYVVQNWALGFFLRRNATVTMTSSKSETGHTCLLSVRVTQHGLKYVDTFSNQKSSQIWINKM